VDTVQVGNESWSHAFAHVQGKYDVIAPLRVVYEVGNIVHRKHPDVFGKSLEDRQQVVAEILQGVKIAAWEKESIARVGAITETHGVTYYDATFLDLALTTQNGVLVVQDGKLHEVATKALGKDRVFNLDQLTEAVKQQTL
jgi:predicted nucleic acid-binding protein